MIHRMADCTIQAMLYVVINEFTTPEKEGKLGVMVSFCSIELFLFILCFFVILFSFGLNGILVFFYYTVVI